MANNIDIAIKAKNEASGAIKQVGADLQGLDKAAGGASGGMGMLGGLLAGGLIAGGLMMVADKAVEAAGAVYGLSRAAESFNMLENSFQGLAAGVGQSSAQMLDSMRTASGGMIADQELILSANRAMMLGVADTSDEMAQLLEVASIRGRAMGLSTSQAFNDLVTGLGRMSPMILDNLGIVTGGEKVFNDYAASLGRTAESLTDAERKQALFNKVLAETNTNVELPVSQFERMDAAIENAKLALGELFSPAVAAIAQNLADAVTEATDAMTTDAIETAQANLQIFGNEAVLLSQKLQTLRDESAIAQVGGDTAGFAQVQQELENTAASLQVYVDNYNAAARVTNAPLLDIDALKNGEVAFLSAADAAALLGQQATATAANTDQLKAAMILAGYATAGFASGLSQVQAQAGATMGIIYNLTGAISQLNAVTGVMRANSDLLGGISGQVNGIASGLINNLGVDAALAKGQELKVQYREQIESLRAQGYTTAEIGVIMQANVQETQQWASDLDKVETATGGVGAATAAVNQEYEDLKSKIQGVLSGALDSGVGVNASDFLPREDDINENARRLADIAANGFKGQEWLEEFAAEAPAAYQEIMDQVAAGVDAKSAAARILRDFEDGMRPDLIDKALVKERVKRMIVGDQNMAALAEEIAQELAAEMGIPLQEAMAAAGASMGVTTGAAGEAATAAAGAGGTDMTGGGAMAGQTWIAGFMATADGTQIVAGIVTKLSAELPKFLEAGTGATDMTSGGAMAGQTFIAGFLANADGTQIVAGIVTKLQTEMPKFLEAGKGAGTQWGAGFMTTVESGIANPLINLLVTLVTPGVMAQQAARQTQTEAP